MLNIKLRTTISTSVSAFLVGLVLLALILPFIVDGQGLYGDESVPTTGAGGFVPLERFDSSAKLRDAYTTEGPNALRDFLNKVFVGAISLGAILAVLRLAWAGFQYMASDLWSSKEHAKEVIKDTLLGLFLLIGIYLILKQINPQILELNVTAGTPASSPGAASSNPFIANQPTDI